MLLGLYDKLLLWITNIIWWDGCAQDYWSWSEAATVWPKKSRLGAGVKLNLSVKRIGWCPPKKYTLFGWETTSLDQMEPGVYTFICWFVWVNSENTTSSRLSRSYVFFSCYASFSSLTWGSVFPAGLSIACGSAIDTVDTQPLECAAFDMTMPMPDDQEIDDSLDDDGTVEKDGSPPKVGCWETVWTQRSNALIT